MPIYSPVLALRSAGVGGEIGGGESGVLVFTTVGGGGYEVTGSIRAGFSTIPGFTNGALHSGDLAGYTEVAITTEGEVGGEIFVHLRIPDTGAPGSPQTAFFSQFSIPGEAAPKLSSTVWGFQTDSVTFPGFIVYRWYWGDSSLDSIFYNGGAGATLTATFT